MRPIQHALRSRKLAVGRVMHETAPLHQFVDEAGLLINLNLTIRRPPTFSASVLGGNYKPSVPNRTDGDRPLDRDRRGDPTISGGTTGESAESVALRGYETSSRENCRDREIREQTPQRDG